MAETSESRPSDRKEAETLRGRAAVAQASDLVSPTIS